MVVLVSVASTTRVWAQAEGDKLEAFFKTWLDQRFELRPVEATQLGDHRFDSRLGDLTPAARAKWLEQTRHTLAELPDKVDYKKLSRAGQIDFEILQHYLKFQEWQMENLRPFEQDPRIYNDYISDSIYLLLTQSTLPLETNVANCIARMAQIPEVVAAARANLSRKPSGFRTHTETAIRQNRGAIDFYEREMFVFAGKTRQATALKSAALPVVAVLKEYQQFLENDLLPKAKADWRLGTEKFARKLELELDAAISATELVADAEKEFARVEREMYVVARQLWSKYSAPKPLPPDDPEGRQATVQRVLEAIAKEHCRPSELTAEMKQRVTQLKKFITANDILRLPEPDHCKVVEMPEYRRGVSIAYCDSTGPLEKKQESVYAIAPTPSDWPPIHFCGSGDL